MGKVWLKAVIGAATIAIVVGLVATRHLGSSAFAEVAIYTPRSMTVTKPLREMKNLNLPPVMRRIIGDQHYTQQQINELRQRLIESGKLEPREEIEEEVEPPLRKRPALPVAPQVGDPVMQRGQARLRTFSFIEPLASFDGIGQSSGDTPSCAPPDTNSAVGDTYVVELVNLCGAGVGTFEIFQKDGASVLGPVPLSNLWTDGVCATDGSGDGIVVYDQLAHRWLLTQFAGKSAPTDECVAISVNDDPTGSYYLYDFPVFPTEFADYPKIGVWPDGYYASFNVFNQQGTAFNGEGYVVFERAAMLSGDPGARKVIFKGNGTDDLAYSLLPADVDGMTPPPVGAPGIFVDFVSPYLWGTPGYALEMWRLKVDWSNPANSTLTGPTQIDVAAFNDGVCNGQRACIAQPNPGEGLDAITDRLMNRLVYRNMGTHESLLVNQTVGVSSSSPPTGVRWYELSTSAVGADDWSVAQQATFAPTDGNSRWMGSIAMDHSGNIALGYSLTSTGMPPSIAYTGRLATDPAGMMTLPETVLATGSGVQVSTGNRWGDYSSMQVDPTDDCTFWFTQEYYTTSGAYAWSTHIGAFKMPNCTQGPVGTLSGMVTHAADGQPAAESIVNLTPGGISVRPRSDGNYLVRLAVGSYTACVSEFGYAQQCAPVSITDGGSTVGNFQLVATPPVTVSGTVRDGFGHGYGLYSEITVTDAGWGTVAEVFTDPMGHYSLQLPDQATYSFTVKSKLDGYETGNLSVAVDGNTLKDFDLAINSLACTAPGYNFEGGGFGEDFDSATFPPDDWTVTNDAGNTYPVIWKRNTDWNYGDIVEDNYTGGNGYAATVDDYKAGDGRGAYDTSLVTPVLNVADLPSAPVLQYRASYMRYSTDALDLDIRVDGGSWQNVTHWTGDHGTRYGLPGAFERVSLAPYVSGATTIQLRWRYYNADPAARDWYAQIDDVSIGHCLPSAGGLVYGFVTTTATNDPVNGATIGDGAGHSLMTAGTPDDTNLGDGFYYAFFGPSSGVELTAATAPYLGYLSSTANVAISPDSVVRQDFALRSGKLVPSLTRFTLDVPANGTVTRTISLGNAGDGALDFNVLNLNAPTGASQPSGPFARAVMVDNLPGAPRLNAANVRGLRFTQPDDLTSGGNVILSFATSYGGSYGLGFDRRRGDVWVGSVAARAGDDRDHRFSTLGADSGESMDTTVFDSQFAADMSFNDITGNFWQLGIMDDVHSCIYELDPDTKMATGQSICPPFALSQRGLAYDPVSDTWFATEFINGLLYHFDSSGRIIDSKQLTDGSGKPLPLDGATYNPGTGHLFVSLDTEDSETLPILVLDVNDDYRQVGTVTSTPESWFPGVGAGLSHDCDGHLWLTNLQASGVSGAHSVFEIGSGEVGWCDFKMTPWLSNAASSGHIDAGVTMPLAISFTPRGHKPGDTLEGQVVLTSNTPEPVLRIPVTVHVTAAVPADLAVSGSGPEAAAVGDTLTYTFTVSNVGEGTATSATFEDQLSGGLTFESVSASIGNCAESGGNVNCAFGDLAKGASATVTVVTQAPVAGTAANDVSVATLETDADASNNSVSLKTQVAAATGGDDQTPPPSNGDNPPSNGDDSPPADNGGQSHKSSGGGAFDWLTLLALMAGMVAIRATRRGRRWGRST